MALSYNSALTQPKEVEGSLSPLGSADGTSASPSPAPPVNPSSRRDHASPVAPAVCRRGRARRLAACSCAVAALLLLAPAPTAAEPEATEPAWGRVKEGLCIAAVPHAQPVAKTSLRLKLTLVCRAEDAVDLPPVTAVSGWLFLGQGRGRSYYSKPVAFTAETIEWPDKLAPGKEVGCVLDLGDVPVYRFARGTGIDNGYPAEVDADAQPVAVLKHVLSPARPARISLFLNLDRAPDDRLTLTSKSREVDVAPPQLERLPAAVRRAYVQRLLARFQASAAAASQACPEAVALGAQISAELAPPVLDRETPSHSRMWLATALAAIGDPVAVRALLQLVGDDDVAVRKVVAYHGPRAEAARLDAAILERAQSLRDPVFTGWAVRGFTTFRGRAPRALLQAALQAEQPKLRLAAVIALGKDARPEDVQTLCGLLGADDERTRAAAARGLANAGRERVDPKALQALVQALAHEGNYARMHICRALDRLTGGDGSHTFTPETSAEARANAVRHWQEYDPQEAQP